MQFEEANNYILTRLKKDLPATLYYHNVAHTNDVYEACKRLVTLENINLEDTNLLLTAACFHDAGFLTQYNDHELISCEIARQALPGYGYEADEIDQICSMIMATQLPQSPRDHLGEILADADLDYLGRDDFFLVSNRLYLELFASGTVKSLEDWNQVQIDFFESHSYFTKTARQLRQLKKEEHLKLLKAKLKK
ncbi:MAG: phosphohydrolase [Mucilaginibacter sp.]|nr:phosphohydrolase [Mucilaginibacter sp.]